MRRLCSIARPIWIIQSLVAPLPGAEDAGQAPDEGAEDSGDAKSEKGETIIDADYEVKD